MNGDQMLAVLFGAITLSGLLFALADLRAAYRDLTIAATWADGKPEHEMMRHAFRSQGARCLSLGILTAIAVLAFTPLLASVFAWLMFGVAGTLTIDAIAARFSRLRILKMIEQAR